MLQEKGYQVDVYPKDEVISQRKLIRVLKKGTYDAVLCLLTDRITGAVLDATPSVKMYANYATGFDNIDLRAARDRGVTVANSPADFSAEAVAEHTIALMLALAARIVEADDFVRRGKYKGWGPMIFIGTDLLGKTLGIVGAGRIGARVAHYCKGLGMNIIYTDMKQNQQIEQSCGATYCASIEELLQKADVVSLHVPALDSTTHLINDARFALMKPSAFLINTARGPVVEERALERSLKNKTIAGAALDVFEFEPKVSSVLKKMPTVILTPHIASASDTARNQMAEIAAANIIDFFEGRQPRNSVTL